MGGFVSKADRSAKERSDAIDRQIQEDSKQLKKEHKILLLGEYFKCPLYTYLFGLSKPFPLSSTLFFGARVGSLFHWMCLFREDGNGHSSLCAGERQPRHL